MGGRLEPGRRWHHRAGEPSWRRPRFAFSV